MSVVDAVQQCVIMTDYLHQSTAPKTLTTRLAMAPSSVLSGTVTCRKCTSQSNTIRGRDTIEDYLEAGLDRETFVDPEVRNTSRTRLVRKLGTLTEYDRQKFGL